MPIKRYPEGIPLHEIQLSSVGTGSTSGTPLNIYDNSERNVLDVIVGDNLDVFAQSGILTLKVIDVVSTSSFDHGGLAGLSDDDHSQYALLAGRSTGQTLIGGIAAGEDLTLTSTSHATKGDIIFGASGITAYDGTNNRLGIGTSSPDNTLTVNGDTNISEGFGIIVGHTAQIDFGVIPEFQVLGTSTPDSSMGFARFEDNVSGPDVRFLKSRGATIGANIIVQDGDTLGRFRFQGADGGDFNTTAAQVHAEVDGTPSLNNIPGRLIFTTRTDGGSLSEKMRLDNAGNLGIGTTNPDGILHLDNGTSNTEFILEKDAGTVAAILFHNAGVEEANISFNGSENIVIENDVSNKDIIFKINDGGVDTEVMRIDGSTSNVGINTTSSTSKLEVRGGTGGASDLVSFWSVVAGSVLTARELHKFFYDSNGDGRYLMLDKDNTNRIDIKANGDSFFLGGDIGIGTSSPNGLLHLDNGTSNTDFIIEKDAATRASIRFHNAGVEEGNITFDSNEDIIIENDANNKDIIFKVNDGGVDTEMMRIKGSTSRIGIGEIVPDAKLEINTQLNTEEALHLKAVTNQTADLFHLTSSTDSDFFVLDSGGNVTIGNWLATNISLAKGGTGAALSDPGADRLFGWDDSDGATEFFSVESGLRITGNVLHVDDSVAREIALTDDGGNSIGTIPVSIDAHITPNTFGLIAGPNISLTGGNGTVKIEASGVAGGAFTSFVITDSVTPRTVNDGETINFVDGTGINVVITANGDDHDVTFNVDDSIINNIGISTSGGVIGGDTFIAFTNHSLANTLGLKARPGIELWGDNSAGEIYIGSDDNVPHSIALTANGGSVGGTNPITVTSHSTPNTLGFVAGTNMTLTGSATGTITFASDSVFDSFVITDTFTPRTVNDGETIKFVDGTGINVIITANGDDHDIDINITDAVAMNIALTADGGSATGTNPVVFDSHATANTFGLIAGDNITLTGGAGTVKITGSAGGSFTDFIVGGDTGADQTITDGNTLNLIGGTGISTVGSATDNLTINVDDSVPRKTVLTAVSNGTQTGDSTVNFDNHATTNAFGLIAGSGIWIKGVDANGQMQIGINAAMLQTINVVTDVQVTGTTLQKKTVNVLVFKGDTETGWTTFHTGTNC